MNKVIGVLLAAALVVSGVGNVALAADSNFMSAMHQRFQRAHVSDPDIDFVAASQGLTGNYGWHFHIGNQSGATVYSPTIEVTSGLDPGFFPAAASWPFTTSLESLAHGKRWIMKDLWSSVPATFSTGYDCSRTVEPLEIGPGGGVQHVTVTVKPVDGRYLAGAFMRVAVRGDVVAGSNTQPEGAEWQIHHEGLTEIAWTLRGAQSDTEYTFGVDIEVQNELDVSVSHKPDVQTYMEVIHIASEATGTGISTSDPYDPVLQATYRVEGSHDWRAVSSNAWMLELAGLPEPAADIPAVALVIDEDSIHKDNPPNFFSEDDVNGSIADIGLREQLPFFAAHAGETVTLHSGEVGDEGWFALKTIPDSWAAAGPTDDGLRNYWTVGPGLGTPDFDGDREALLDKIPEVTPLRATGLKMLEGRRVCAVVYDSDISMNYDPLEGSLKGKNLGVVAFEVVSVTQLEGYSSSSLPQVEIRILDAGEACMGPLTLFAEAPEPTSSSEPFDVVPPTFLRLQSWMQPDAPLTQPLQNFAQAVEEGSGGSVLVELYPSNALVPNNELGQAVSQGDIEMALTISGWLRPLSPVMEGASLPFLYNNDDGLAAAVQAGIGDLMSEALQPHNITVIDWANAGVAHLFLKDGMLTLPADLDGQAMRVPGHQSIQAKAILEWHGTPIALIAHELYEALRRGVVDGTAFPLNAYYQSKLYEVSPHFTMDYAFANLAPLCINSDVWNSLKAEERQILTDAARDFASEMLDTVKGTDADALQWIQDYGVTVNTLTPEERAVWREASRPIWEDWLDEVGTQLGQQIIDIALAHNPLPDVLSIGCLAPITGPAAGKGEPMFHGEQDYFRYVNRSGGIGDYAVYATFYDDEYNDTLASQYYEEAVADGALVVTAMSSKITAALCCLYDADGMPFLHAFSAPFCLHPPGHAYATLPTYGDGLAAFMQWLESTGGTPCTLALYGLNNPTGEGASDAARALAESLDIEVVGYWDHPSDLDDVEAKATLLEIMEAAEGSPFWLFVSSTPGPSATIAMAAVDPEVALPAGICLGHASALPAFVDLAGSAAEGVYGMQSPVFWGASVPAMPALTQYCQTYHPGDEGNPDYMLGWQLGMCAAESLKNAVIQSGGEALTPQIVEANGVRQVSFDAGGLTGWVDWMDDYDRRGAKSINLALVQGGQWEVLAPWIEAPLIHYEDYSWFDPIECP